MPDAIATSPSDKFEGDHKRKIALAWGEGMVSRNTLWWPEVMPEGAPSWCHDQYDWPCIYFRMRGLPAGEIPVSNF
jgi:hypothetical protein